MLEHDDDALELEMSSRFLSQILLPRYITHSVLESAPYPRDHLIVMGLQYGRTTQPT